MDEETRTVEERRADYLDARAVRERAGAVLEAHCVAGTDASDADWGDFIVATRRASDAAVALRAARGDRAPGLGEVWVP